MAPELRRRSAALALVSAALLPTPDAAGQLLNPGSAEGPARRSAGAGPLVILGGAVRDDHDRLWQAVVDAAGGPGARIAVLAAASEAPQRTGAHAAEMLQRRGAVTDLLPIGAHWPGLDAAAALAQAQDPQWVDRVQQADGLFMTGGFQSRLMDLMQTNTGGSPLLQALRQLQARGGAVAGTSAGAAVLSETAIRALDRPFDALLRPLQDQEFGTGFGLAPPDLVVDQHFLRQGRIARLVRVLLQTGRSLGLGVDEDSGALLRDGAVQALGRQALVMIDAREAVLEQAQPLAVRLLRLSWIEAGDRFDMTTRRLVNTPADAAPPGAPSGEAPPPATLSFEPLRGAAGWATAVAHAAQGVGHVARGVARSNAATLGFEWRLSADAHTRVGRPVDGRRGSVDGLRLDIQPLPPDAADSTLR